MENSTKLVFVQSCQPEWSVTNKDAFEEWTRKNMLCFITVAMDQHTGVVMTSTFAMHQTLITALHI